MKAKIYTKTGDAGQTSLVGGKRVLKSNFRLEVYGTVDELNSAVGVVRAHLLSSPSSPFAANLDKKLQRIQNALFNLGSHLACEDEKLREQLPQVRGEDLAGLEADMDLWESELPALKNFILPGGSSVAAFAHLARTICRRTERLALRLREEAHVDPQHLVFLNRLSDWLFLLARKANAQAKVRDIEWSKD